MLRRRARGALAGPDWGGSAQTEMRSTRSLGRLVLALTVASLSVGWIMPLYLAADSYLHGFEILLRGTEPANSFPFFQFGSQALYLGAVWCNLSAVGWGTVCLLRAFRGSRPSQPSR